MTAGGWRSPEPAEPRVEPPAVRPGLRLLAPSAPRVCQRPVEYGSPGQQNTASSESGPMFPGGRQAWARWVVPLASWAVSVTANDCAWRWRLPVLAPPGGVLPSFCGPRPPPVRRRRGVLSFLLLPRATARILIPQRLRLYAISPAGDITIEWDGRRIGYCCCRVRPSSGRAVKNALRLGNEVGVGSGCSMTLTPQEWGVGVVVVSSLV
jgi:hypothetical protein